MVGRIEYQAYCSFEIALLLTWLYFFHAEVKSTLPKDVRNVLNKRDRLRRSTFPAEYKLT
jgi:hypothetical protein